MAFSGITLVLARVLKARTKNPLFFSVVKNAQEHCTLSAEYSTSSKEVPMETTKQECNDTISRVMKSYMDRAKELEEFRTQQLKEYEEGKKFLAKIMGKNQDEFVQKDVDEALEYLLPSSLYIPKARPVMKHPDVFFPQIKEVEFDNRGRPFHYLFYTIKYRYVELLHECGTILQKLNEKAMKMEAGALHKPKAIDVSGTTWLPKKDLEKILEHKLLDVEYKKFIDVMERLLDSPYSFEELDFIMKYRIPVGAHLKVLSIAEPIVENGISRVTTSTCRRKRATGTVTVFHPGTGKITINGKNMTDFFEHFQSREQVLFPLIFTDMLGKVDVEAEVSDSGYSSQAGVVRYGISMGLISFVSSDMILKLKLAGLIYKDPRTAERQKPGQRGARRKYTWKKR